MTCRYCHGVGFLPCGWNADRDAGIVVRLYGVCRWCGGMGALQSCDPPAAPGEVASAQETVRPTVIGVDT